MSDLRSSTRQRVLGLLAMATACSIWGLGPIWIRILLGYLPPVEIACLRVTLGGLTILPCLLWYDCRRVGFMLRKPATWIGGVFMGSSMLAYAAALQYIRPSEVNLVFQANIVLSALLGLWLYHESVPPRRWLACAVVLSGVTMVILARDEQAPMAANWTLRLAGMGLGLLGGLGAGCVQASMRDVADAGVGLAALVPMHLVAAVAFAATAGFQLHWRQPPDGRFLLYQLLLGIFASGIASILGNYAIRRISLAQAGVTGSMQPVVTIVATTLTGEVLPPLGLAGGALVVGGVTYSALLEQQVRDLRHERHLGVVPSADTPMVEPPELDPAPTADSSDPRRRSAPS